MARISLGDLDLYVTDRGTGRPLLLVHGFPLDHSMWASQIDYLAEHYRVIAPDLRGFGQSDVTAGTVTMEQYAEDLAALLRALQVNEPVVFCGLSMGGYIGWQFWACRRHRLAGLIACDTRSVADSAEAAAGRLKTALRTESEGAQVVADTMLPKLFGPQTTELNGALVAATRDVILRTSPQGIAAALRGMAQRPDFTRRLPEIDVPTLVIGGEHDGISTPAEMRQMAAAIPGAQFVEVPAAGHMAPLENPAIVNPKIAQFLANIQST